MSRLPYLFATFAILQSGCVSLPRSKPPAPQGAVTVVVSRRDLHAGLPISADDVAERKMDAADVDKEHSFASLVDVLGRTPRERILANEPIREERLARPDASVGLNAILTPGKRAITVEVSGAALWQPGNYVDVGLYGPKECPYVGPTLQGVRVLALDGVLDGAPDGWVGAPSKREKEGGTPRSPDRRVVTLELLPSEAQMFNVGSICGVVSLQLRSDIDILQASLPSNAPPPCFPLPFAETAPDDAAEPARDPSMR